MRSVTHLLLEAWAFCNECVPLLPLFNSAVNSSDLTGLDPKDVWFPSGGGTLLLHDITNMYTKRQRKKTGKL